MISAEPPECRGPDGRKEIAAGPDAQLFDRLAEHFSHQSLIPANQLHSNSISGHKGACHGCFKQVWGDYAAEHSS
jgi:hypothetical protein